MTSLFCLLAVLQALPAMGVRGSALLSLVFIFACGWSGDRGLALHSVTCYSTHLASGTQSFDSSVTSGRIPRPCGG